MQDECIEIKIDKENVNFAREGSISWSSREPKGVVPMVAQLATETPEVSLEPCDGPRKGLEYALAPAASYNCERKLEEKETIVFPEQGLY